jgi:predicted dienelactone hydrolase
MKRNWPQALLCLALALASASSFAVGFVRVSAPDPEGAALDVGVWYPSTATAVAVAMGPVTQTVALGAPIAGDALPLVVISHGTGGSMLSHYDTAIALAQAGFVVASVVHTGDNYRDQSRAVFILDRPGQVSRVIDYLLSGWSGHGHIDPARIGVFGFSAGGFTALVDIGGRPDLAKVAPFCQEHATDYACQLTAAHPEARASAEASSPARRDARIKSAVVAAPALGFTFAPDGLQGVTIPISLWRAEDDTVLPHPWYAEAVRQALPQPPEFHLVPKAGHYDFLAPCSAELAALAPAICTSAAGFDRGAFHASFNPAVVEFFSRTLKP